MDTNMPKTDIDASLHSNNADLKPNFKKYDDRTREILDSLGFKNYELVSGLQNVRRIIVNDYNEANPYPRATSINLKRDTDNLKDFI